MILPSFLRCTAVAIFLVGARRAVPLFAAATYPAPSNPQQKSTQTQPQSRTQKLANPLNDLLDEAQHDIDANQFEAALTPLQKFLAEKPEIAWAHFQLAYAYTALKRTDEARDEYERATTLDPKMSEAFLNLGILLTEKDPAAAVVPLRRAVDLLPAQSRPRFLLGHALERSGDIPGAADCYEAALRLDARDVETIIHLGNLYLGLKRYPDAETKFRAGLELEPKSPQALLGLAETLDAQKKPEAAGAFRDYLAVQPDAPGAQSRVIHLLLEQKQYEAALTELDRAEAGKTPTLDSLRSRADIQIAQKKWDDAIISLRKAITLAPNDADLRGGLGRVFMQKRDFASAEKEIKVALEMDRNNLVYWKDLRSTYYLGGNYSATLATQDLIAKVETPGAGEWFIRALCYDKLNQPKPALEAYEKFLELDQDKNPNQVWQAQQRSKVLRRMLDQKR
jgi:tetratricopeptide (TPR) repeat protein